MTPDTKALSELVDHILDDDHRRGCEGRCYDCECGYDDRTVTLAFQVRALLSSLSPELAGTNDHD